MPALRLAFPLLILACSACSGSAKIGGWDAAPNTQYHIQTDEGPERYFKYQTISGQYRKERRLEDGSVVGSYGWVDANGLLRLRDYVADNKGYRIVRTKTVHVGSETPIGAAVAAAKKVPSQGGVGVTTPGPPPAVAVAAAAAPLAPISLSDYLKSAGAGPSAVDVVPNGYPEVSTALPPARAYSHVEPVTYRPFYGPNSLDDYESKLAYDSVGAGRYESAAQSASRQYPHYDGVAFTHNGFRYYLPRHYHEEESLPGDAKAGSFGYIDPFGIRRVVYYNAAPGSGFVHRKNNRYVGFQATPYDPRF